MNTMAKIIHTPSLHDTGIACQKEFAELGPIPVGTIAECSCGDQYICRDEQKDGPYWAEYHLINVRYR